MVSFGSESSPDFSLKYSVSIDLNKEINIENYVAAIANEIGPIVLFYLLIERMGILEVLLMYKKLLSAIWQLSYLTAGYGGYGGKLGHIKFFRRQFEMVFNDDVKFIDEHFDIQFGIYIMSDGPVCFTCNNLY